MLDTHDACISAGDALIVLFSHLADPVGWISQVFLGGLREPG